MDITIVINQMIVLFLLMGVGYVVTKSKLGDYRMQEVVTTLILNVSAPAMMLSSVTGGQAKSSLKEVMLVFLISIIMYAIMPFLGMGMAKLLRINGAEKNLYIFMTAFSNIGFMGFPVIRSIFGETGVFYAAIVNMIFNIVSFSYGMALMSGEKISFDIKKYINPGIVSAILTITLFFLKVPFHPSINQGVRSLGDTTTPLAMLVIGMSLGRIPLNSLFKDLRIIPFTLIKQIVIPMIALFLLRPIIHDPLILGVTIVVIAMPVATNCVLFATKFNNNVETATRGVFLTTVMSLITIPLISLLLH